MKQAFTVTYPKIVDKIKLPVTIKTDKNSVSAVALWDTGATICVISDVVVNALSLVPRGMLTLSGVNSVATHHAYDIDLLLPNEVSLQGLAAVNAPIDEQGIDLIIGMNVMSFCDFCVTNYQGKTMFSFRMPSLSHIDLVGEPTKTEIVPFEDKWK